MTRKLINLGPAWCDLRSCRANYIARNMSFRKGASVVRNINWGMEKKRAANSQIAEKVIIESVNMVALVF